jgi:two-component sensor histidine kinase
VQGLLSRLNEHDRVDFDDLIRSVLSALHADPNRTTISGPRGVRLRSSTVQTLAMALHELATNAVKYGALAQASAVVGGKSILHIDWRESGVTMPAQKSPLGGGQGRELIERALPYQWRAVVQYELGRDGLRYQIRLPESEASDVGELSPTGKLS